MDTEEFSLRGVEIPEDVPLRRDSTVPERFRDDTFGRLHDDRTVIYDAVRLSRRAVVLTCPQLNNLWPVLRDGLRVDGRPVRRLRRTSIGRIDQLRLAVPHAARLGLRLGDVEVDVPIRKAQGNAFRGRNLLFCISRNNDPAWIAGWARFHARTHGADAVIVFDNASDRYGRDAVLAALAEVSELAVARVIGAPFRYGGIMERDGRKFRVKHLQTAIINITRIDMGARARAVLSCDIDEMVLRRSDKTVFDAARATLRGGIQLKGQWVFPETPDHAPCAQHEHQWWPEPVRQCQFKWCAVARHPFSRLGGWDVHSFGGDWLRRWRSLRPDHPDFTLVHCAGTTTGWKPESRRFDFPKALRHDPDLAQALAAARS